MRFLVFRLQFEALLQPAKHGRQGYRGRRARYSSKKEHFYFKQANAWAGIPKVGYRFINNNLQLRCAFRAYSRPIAPLIVINNISILSVC